ncbi:hypothetical protein KsCSTR_35820 [Candidatus Kuenenia stuttgartiensis]|uniref:Uncharacterized protein n=1 Tax=Kuenenia stuttgartiensis TaxID=174633 RepID=Q1Q6M8_KUEST|nr:hypothetical protein KsCSTR_35820 [Candidatus Kuenenia stuttgartiensis]CAJ73233.1 unknown protein [Candidatus Kuenenia stuttgartiensis]
MQCRGEAFVVNCHKCVHTQTGKCFTATVLSNVSILAFLNRFEAPLRRIFSDRIVYHE